MNDNIFKYMEYFYFALIIPITFAIRYFLIRKRNLSISSLSLFKSSHKSIKLYFRYSQDILRTIALLLILTAIARPIITNNYDENIYEGIDIVFAFDISGSMLANDFSPNRLELAKKTAIKFISKRKSDRIGIVVYAGEAYTLVPPSSDIVYLTDKIKSIKTGQIQDGTALGVGLATAINSLADSKAKNKVIILLSDGSNNCGSIDPSTALEIARTLGLKVYTIGIGREGKAEIPENADGTGDMIEVDVSLEESQLREIALQTNGKYFRADKSFRLEQIYREIDKLEKTPYKTEHRHSIEELWIYPALLALLLLLFEFIVRTKLIRTAE